MQNNGSTTKGARYSQKYKFIIPIYSGVLGLLMPDKKLLPLNLLPLDIEIVFNPYALYSSGTFNNAGANAISLAAENTNKLTNGSRAYKINEFHIFSHMIFFE